MRDYFDICNVLPPKDDKVPPPKFAQLFRQRYYGPKDRVYYVSLEMEQKIKEHAVETNTVPFHGDKIIVDKYMTGKTIVIMEKDEWGEYQIVKIVQ